MRAARASIAVRAGYLVLAGLVGAGCAGPSAGLQGRIEPAAGHEAPSRVEKTVVYLVGGSPEQESSTASQSAILIEDGSGLHPGVVAVSSGTRVEFRNRDHLFHKMFSVSPVQPFDSGAIAPGESRFVLFDHPGAIQVFCELHPQESAFIYVVPTRRYARADAQGRFHFADVPPGSYTLHTWHPDRGETSQAVVVPRHGELRVTVSD